MCWVGKEGEGLKGESRVKNDGMRGGDRTIGRQLVYLFYSSLNTAV